MSSRSGLVRSVLLGSFACVVGSALVACAGPRAGMTTTTASAEVAQDEAREANVVAPVTAREAPAADVGSSETSESAAPGQLVCRAKDAFGVASALYITWSGKEGKGVLRQTAPSGMETETKVRAEREGSLLFADDVKSEPDLLAHTATVGTRDGKTYMRLGDMKAPWTACE